jgi:hypothetical protein
MAWVPSAVTVRLAKMRPKSREDRSGARSSRNLGTAGSPSDTRPTVTPAAARPNRVSAEHKGDEPIRIEAT